MDYIDGSLLFTDDRQIDVQFAFIVDNSSLGIQLSHQIPRGSRFHPREVVGVTCVASCLLLKDEQPTNLNCYVSIVLMRSEEMIEIEILDLFSHDDDDDDDDGMIFLYFSLTSIHWITMFGTLFHGDSSHSSIFLNQLNI